MKLFSIKLPEDHYLKLKQYAKENNTTMSEVIRLKIKPVIQSVVETKKDFFEATNHLKGKVRDNQFKGYSEDEILYGYEYDKKGNKVWKKKKS